MGTPALRAGLRQQGIVVFSAYPGLPTFGSLRSALVETMAYQPSAAPMALVYGCIDIVVNLMNQCR